MVQGVDLALDEHEYDSLHPQDVPLEQLNNKSQDLPQRETVTFREIDFSCIDGRGSIILVRNVGLPLRDYSDCGTVVPS